METDDGRQSPESSMPIASTSALPDLSTDNSGSLVRVESSQSENTGLVSDSAFQTPEAGVSALSLPPLSSPTSLHFAGRDGPRYPGRVQVRDSGIDTSTPTNRRSVRISQSLPNLSPLMPPGEDRPDLWRNDLEPPTFRPRTQAAADPPPPLTEVEHRIGDGGVDDDLLPTQPRPRGWRRILAFLGYGTGNRYRKELVALVWNLGFGLIQIIVTLAFVIYSSVHNSPRKPTMTEWTACDKPLGIWACFWIGKVILDCGMGYWGWRRDWKGRQEGQSRSEVDVEQGRAGPNLGPVAPVDTNLDPPPVGPVDRQRRRLEYNAAHYKLYTRLSLLLSLIILSWFLTSNILVFTSLKSCRYDAPHLWWLVFSLLCLQYLVILEVLLTAIIVFIVGPLIYLIWSIVLICLGRHPMQNPYHISPEVGKVSKSVADQIPLVLYIPAPPDGQEKELGVLKEVDSKPEAATVLKQDHTYPPKQSPTKRRFAFLRRKSSKPAASGSASTAKTDEGGEKSLETWEDFWESGEYPFVRLDPNRASCAICLVDFEEPKRRVARDVIRSWLEKNKVGASPEGIGEEKSEEGEPEEHPVKGAVEPEGDATSDQPVLSTSRPEVQHEPPSSEESALPIRLEDAGESTQPLRLLQCGHVFHKTCIDPWLTQVSGRCPTCQRPVIPPDRPGEKRNRRDS